MSVQPIRLFGDPVLRTAAAPVLDFDKEIRTLVADLTETMLDAPGAGLAAPQIGVGLRVFTWHVDGELGHLVNPDLTLSEELQDGPEGCLSLPGLTIDCKRALHVVARGFDMHGEPVTIEGSELLARAIQHETDHLDGILFLDRLDREARREAMRIVRESEWFGEPAPVVEVLPAHDPRARPVRVVFAGTPEVALPALEAVAASAHDLVGVVTRPDAPAGRGRRMVASPVGLRAEELGVPVLKPAHPREPEFQAALAALEPDCVPVVAYGALIPESALVDPGEGLGQPPLLGAARVARRGARAARDLGGRRGDRCHHVPDRLASSTPDRRTA